MIYSLTHFALHDETGHCLRFRSDSQGTSPKKVPHLGQT